jgi:hypothetical protein
MRLKMTNSQCLANDQGMPKFQCPNPNAEPAISVIDHLALVIPWSLAGHWELVICPRLCPGRSDQLAVYRLARAQFFWTVNR